MAQHGSEVIFTSYKLESEATISLSRYRSGFTVTSHRYCQRSPHFKQMWVRDHSHSHRFRPKVTIVPADEGQRSLLAFSGFPWAPQFYFLGHVTSDIFPPPLVFSRLLGTCLLCESPHPWQSWFPPTSTETGQPTRRLSMKQKYTWASMLVFAMVALGCSLKSK